MQISLQSYADSLKDMLNDATQREALALAGMKDLTAKCEQLEAEIKELKAHQTDTGSSA